MKTLLIEEHQAILQGLKCTLDNSIFSFKIDSYSSIKQLEIPLDFLINDIVVLGVPQSFPLLFKWIDNIRAHSSIPILVYGVDESSPMLERLMAEKIQGVVTQQFDIDKLDQVIMETVSNSGNIPKQFGFRVSRYSDIELTSLSAREMEIVYLISEEKTTGEIADELNISISTVENHRKNIFRKMGVKNLAGLVMTANKVGYI
jgi:DNA-binding NarL/FixJ family response regulator